MNKVKLETIENLWFNLSQKFRFFIIGGFNAIVSYCVYSVFCLILGSSKYQIALIIAWIFSSIISFNAQKYLVFQSRENLLKEYLKCCATWSISYLLNTLFLEIFVKFMSLNIFIAQFVSTLSVAVFTFVAFKKFAFKHSCN